jgi:hypothetical protein
VAPPNKIPLLANVGYADLFCLSARFGSTLVVSTLREPVGGREVSGRESENEDGAVVAEGVGFEEGVMAVGDGVS